MTIDVKLFTANDFVLAYDRNEDQNRDDNGLLAFPRRLHVLMYDEERDYVRLEPLSWKAAEGLGKQAVVEFYALFMSHRDKERLAVNGNGSDSATGAELHVDV